MKMHKRTIMFPVFIIACALLVAACGNSSDRQPSSPTLRFWHFWSEPGHKEALKELLKAFEAENHCTVELTELSWNDGKAKLQAAFNSGAPPDVVELGSDWVAQFSGAGVLRALRQIDTTTLIPYSLAPGRHAGTLYAAPWVVDTRVIFVNSAMLGNQRLDSTKTLDQLLTTVERIHGAGTFGWGANGADAHRLYKKILPFLWTHGGDVLDAQGRCVLYSPENVRALTLYADLSRAGMIETQRQLDAAFLQGRIGVWNSGSWLIKKIRNTPNLSVTAIPFPGVEGRPGVSFAGGEYLAVSSASGNPDLSEKLVRFLVSADAARTFCTKIPEAGFPAALAAYDDPALQTDPFKAVFARQLRTARMTPVHPKWLDIEVILEGAVVRVLLGEATPDQALKEAHGEIAEITGK
jgi:ABC-type glycerol-3-phosphate transport system substrate-binding protein